MLDEFPYLCDSGPNGISIDMSIPVSAFLEGISKDSYLVGIIAEHRQVPVDAVTDALYYAAKCVSVVDEQTADQ